jgi:hypothetical protein
MRCNEALRIPSRQQDARGGLTVTPASSASACFLLTRTASCSFLIELFRRVRSAIRYLLASARLESEGFGLKNEVKVFRMILYIVSDVNGVAW